jgi:CubicO group peptidase (beta-lactamase class C family)
MVGAYIESTLTGIGYPDFVNSRIFKPLGMTSSTYSIKAALQSGRFTDTWTSFGRLIPPWIEEEFVDLIAGPGGVISSVEDLMRHSCLSLHTISTHVFNRPLAQNDSEWWYRP